jgi:predicted nucleic acid-binding protein
MKGLDTPVLLRLLRGEPRVCQYLRKLGPGELCTTTINLFELEAIARSDPAPGRERRLAALEALRRKLSVLPVDESAALAAAAEFARPGRHQLRTPTLLILGTLLAYRCTEWVTTKEAGFPATSELKLVLMPDGKH